MANTTINISLKSKSNATVNLTSLDGGVVSGSSTSIPVINFVATGAQGSIGAQGDPGVSSIDEGQITSEHLSSESVGTSELANQSVTYDKLGVASVAGNRIMPLAITTTRIGNQSVTQSKIADNSVGAAQIINGTITQELLQDLAVHGDKLDDLSITAGKLQDFAIITTKIRDRNVTGAKIASNADLDGEVKANNLKLKGSSPATLTGPDAFALQLKTNTTLDVLNTSGATKASIDQSGNLTLSGTVDGIDIATDVAANTLKTGITTSQANAITANTAKATNIVHPLVETAVPVGALFTDTDTVYTHPTNHAISVTTGLQTALDSKVDDSQVLTDVPSGAVFTDTNTIYTHPANHAISVTTGLQVALDGKVDDNQVLTNVPSGALFTDTNTVYTHPANHAISVVTGLQTALDGKIDDSQVLTDVPSGALFTDTDTIYSHPANHAISVTTGLQTALDGKVDDAQVLTDVPSGALFTDTNTVYDATTIQAEVDLNSAKTSNIVQTTITGNAGTATALTSGNKSIAGNLSVTGSGNTFIMDSVQVATITSSRVVIGQTNRILQLDSSQCRVASVNLGHDTDTTIARVSAGEISVEGVGVQLKNMHHHFIHAGFYLAYPYSRYIPLNGSLNEQNVATSTPEYVNYTFPYDGYVKKMILRSETNMGSTNLKLYKGASGATVTTVLGDVSASVGASAAVEFDFTSVSSAYSKGDTMAIKVAPTEDPDGGQNITIELVFDLTT